MTFSPAPRASAKVRSRMLERVPRGAERMVKGGAPIVASFLAVMLIPISGAYFLEPEDFLIWVLANTVFTVALTIDFGGTVYVARSIAQGSGLWNSMLRGIGLSAAGTIVIGVVAAVAWGPYSDHVDLGSRSSTYGLFVIIAISLAGLLRSSSAVVSVAALALYKYRINAIVVLGQTLLATTIIISILSLRPSVWALPIGWIVGSGFALTAGTLALHASSRGRDSRRGVRTYTQDSDGGVKYVIYRTLAALLGAVLLQVDRWVIGAIASASFLVAYELLWRFASAPRLLAQSLNATVLPDAAYHGETRDSVNLMRQALKVTLVAVVGSGVFSLAAGWVVTSALAGSMSLLTIVTGLMLVISLGVNALGAPVTNTGLGVGYLSIDIPYLAITVLGCGAVWSVALLIESVPVAVFGSTTLITMSSISYIAFYWRKFDSRWESPSAEVTGVNVMKGSVRA